MRRFFKAGLKIVLCYLLAGVIYLLYAGWPHYQGHAHVPFSGFPEYLIWTPVVPYLLLEKIATHPGNAVADLSVFCLNFAGMIWLCFRKRG
jgi:hypothetical protein